MVFIEDIAASISALAKFSGALRAGQSADRVCRSLHAAADDDAAVILFTSAASARPRWCPLTHRNLLANLEGLHGVLDFGPGDVILGNLRSSTSSASTRASGCRSSPAPRLSRCRALSSSAPSAPPSAKSASRW